jgi:Na+/H+ antiporter NhaD/arsenite permease-like protein
VTTVVLTVPMTLFVTRRLEVDPIPYLVGQVIASNIGGTATLIGDPPNIMVGSRARLDFIEFGFHLAPLAFPLLILYSVGMGLFFRNRLQASPDLREALLRTDERELITDPRLLRIGMGVLALTILGFVLHGPLGYEAATIAMAGATVFLVVAKQEVQEALQEVEWTSLMFFVGLFILVESVVKAGLINLLVQGALALTGGDLTTTTLLVLWMSGFLSGIVDNIPYTATMLPLVEQLGLVMPATPLWVALTLGADLGGNLTLIGASANVVVAGIAERQGYPISFVRFLKYGVAATVANLALCSLYLWVRYLRVG